MCVNCLTLEMNWCDNSNEPYVRLERFHGLVHGEPGELLAIKHGCCEDLASGVRAIRAYVALSGHVRAVSVAHLNLLERENQGVTHCVTHPSFDRPGDQEALAQASTPVLTSACASSYQA